MYKLISYRSTGNLGDAIQTISASYFLKSIGIENWDYVDRNSLKKNTLIYGWHRNPYEQLPASGVFLSLHSELSIIQKINKDIIIGSRDSWTSHKCKIIGLKSLITGCITINLPLLKKKKNNLDILYIDSSKKSSTQINLTQKINTNTSWQDQLLLAKNRLELLSTASLVYTTRLHILIPCIAMGIPVVLDQIPLFQPERFSFFKDLIPINKPIELNSGVRDELLDIWKKNSSKIIDSTWNH